MNLQAALDAVKSELMLFGVASLLLSALEGPITSICSKSLRRPITSLPARICLQSPLDRLVLLHSVQACQLLS